MAFMFFRKEFRNNKLYYVNDYDNYQLAGWGGLIYRTWVKRNKPLKGWTLTADDLLKTYSELNNDACNGDNYALVIDYHPGSEERIAFIELERIHIYTYGDEDYVEWSPMMFELRPLFYIDGIKSFSKEFKEKTLEAIEVPTSREQIVEFLYLKGDDYSWNWGRNGMTNAAFIEKEAREFFKQYF